MKLALLAAFCLAVAVAPGLTGCASDDEQVAAYVAEADGYLEQDDPRSALVSLQAALKVQPKNAELNLRIAQLYERLRSPVRAAFFYGEAYRLDPSRTDAGLLQAPALYGSDLAAAEAIIEEILEREPENPAAHVRKSEVSLLRSDTEGALRSALTATQLGPDDPLAWRMLSRVHAARIYERQEREEAIDDDLFEAAVAASERAAELSAGDPEAGPWLDLLDQARTYFRWEGHEADVARSLKEALRLATEAGNDLGRRVVVREARRLAAAGTDLDFRRWAFEQWVQIEPERVAAWRTLAALERATGGSSDEVWARALAERPDDLGLHIGYVRALVFEHRDEEALAHLDGLPDELANSVDAWSARIELHMSKLDILAARDALRELEARHPGEPLTRLNRASFDLRTGETERALKDLRRLAGEVERGDVFRQLAEAEARVGNVDAALAAVERAIDLRPDRAAPVHELRVRLLAKKQDWPGVIRSVRSMRAAGLDISPNVQALRVQALYEMGRGDVARRLIDGLLKRQQAGTPLVLAFAHYEGERQPERTRMLLSLAARQAPRDVNISRALVQAELQAGNAEAALAELDRFRERTGESSGPGLRAQILWALGRQEEAEAAAVAAFHQDPRPFGAEVLLAEVLQARGKTDEAIRIFTEAGDLGPVGKWRLSRLYYQKGELEKALPLLEEAHRVNPNLVEAENDLALVLARLGRDLDRAVDLARDVKSRSPQDPAIADTLGFVYLKKGWYEPATFEFRSAIELARVSGQEVAEYHYHLGLSLRGQGRAEEAGRAFEEALRIEPEHAAALQARSEMRKAEQDSG